jgi:hypothetical protein
MFFWHWDGGSKSGGISSSATLLQTPSHLPHIQKNPGSNIPVKKKG